MAKLVQDENRLGFYSIAPENVCEQEVIEEFDLQLRSFPRKMAGAVCTAVILVAHAMRINAQQR